ncbi:MAG: adenylate/guanylate cyclase domain-containing protein [Planctomycetes bacterium]|nr:adenylate/guanylate cyclase domain-containing protein [Planctomycetota bacterium]
MAEAYKVRILVGEAPAAEVSLDGPLELGRQRAGEPGPYELLPAADAGPARLVIAPQHDKDNISRRHLTLTPLPDGRVRVSNHSQAPLDRADERGAIPAGEDDELAPPFALSLPSRLISVLPADSDDRHGIHSLDEPTQGPASSADFSLSSRSIAQLQPSQMRALLEGVPRALGVLQSAVGTTDFLNRACQALVQTVGLDTGRVLLRKGEAWDVAAAIGTSADRASWRPSRHVLDRLLGTRSAVWQKPQRGRGTRASGSPDSASLVQLDTVVAAPLLDRHEQVIGALYGERRKGGHQAARSDSQVEALLVNLLACGVATGLARLEQERVALRATALFEQFFTPELARHLAADPGLLEGRETDVTVLFADVRSFSKHSEKLGAAETVRWINDVLDVLSQCVQDEGGVLVDYIGDELMAMWGAPAQQPDQAARAVRAGLAMHAALPGLNERWQPILGEPLRIGVGINSGGAQVGNTGSRLKFKYGPLGNTVNLASRVQGLTKYLRCGVLATAATRRQLGDFLARRVVKARVVNIEEPVDLYEVDLAESEERRGFFAESQAALEALESSNFASAARQAGALLAAHSGDGPLLLILARAADALVKAGAGFDPVWAPPGK